MATVFDLTENTAPDGTDRIYITDGTNDEGVQIANLLKGAGAEVPAAKITGTISSAQVGITGGIVGTSDTQTLTNKTINMGDNLLTRPLVKDYAMEVYAHGSISTATTIDLENGNVHTATIGGNLTLTFSNPIASGDATSFVLELTNGGAYTLTFPASVDWEGGTAPTLTAAGIDILVFYTRDGGTIWHGIVSSLDSK